MADIYQIAKEFTFFYKQVTNYLITSSMEDIKQIVQRVQEQLNQNWAVEAEDIQALIDHIIKNNTS